MNKKCYIVGAGDNSGTNFSKGKNEYVIAADGGLATLEKLGIQPDMFLIHLDSQVTCLRFTRNLVLRILYSGEA